MTQHRLLVIDELEVCETNKENIYTKIVHLEVERS